MQKWLNLKQKEIIDKNVKFFYSLNERQKSYFYDMFSDKKLESHIKAVEDGIFYICSTDEYNPFYDGDYMICCVTENDVEVQIAWSKSYKEIYVSGYVPQKNGWYEWKEYPKEFEINETNVNVSQANNKLKSFDEALREAKQRVAVNKNKTAENYYRSKNFNLDKRENTQDDNECVGMPVYSETHNSEANYRTVVIPAVKTMFTIENRLLAIRTSLNFDCSLVNKIYINGVSEAIVKNLPEERQTILRSKDYIYFVMYDGANFIYCGDTKQKRRV